MKNIPDDNQGSPSAQLQPNSRFGMAMEGSFHIQEETLRAAIEKVGFQVSRNAKTGQCCQVVQGSGALPVCFLVFGFGAQCTSKNTLWKMEVFVAGLCVEKRPVRWYRASSCMRAAIVVLSKCGIFWHDESFFFL
jgi:hypothetical protein